jgi:formyltetrahydrofolate deformylase
MAVADPAEAPPLLRMLISCADRPGIIAAVSRFLADAGANIVTSDQYSTDPEGGAFFLRMEFHLDMPVDARADFERRFGRDVASVFQMRWRLWDTRARKKIAIFVSSYDHALLDLLWRWRRNELEAEIACVISNWEDLAEDVRGFGLPYHHIAVDRAARQQAETAQIAVVRRYNCDLVVLARYMQILSADFLAQVGAPVINIHHSFLPAFAGAGPYERAKARGVKLIGATAHYVTEELDAGPIIEQDAARVSHRDSPATMMRRGADVERTVLARAVAWHCADRVLVDGATTVVF